MGNRPTFLAFARQRISIWFGLFLLLTGLIFLVVGTQQVGYETDGQNTQATVFNKRTHRGRDRTIHHVGYRFKTDDGQTHEGEDTTDRKTWERMREGDSVQIEYRRSSPGTNRLAGQPVTSSAFYRRTASVVLLAAALVLFFSVRSAYRAHRSLPRAAA